MVDFLCEASPGLSFVKRFLITDSISILTFCSDYLFLSDWALEDCIFLGTYPFLIGYPTGWCITIWSLLLWLYFSEIFVVIDVCFSGVSSPFFPSFNSDLYYFFLLVTLSFVHSSFLNFFRFFKLYYLLEGFFFFWDKLVLL